MGKISTAQAGPAPAGFLARLRSDQRGNTLAIVAAAIFPIIGFVGSGMDMSRAYLVKTRMQQACDAGALAGRKSMSGTTMTTADKDTAVKFFRFNFPDGTMATQPLTVAATEGPNTITVGPDANGQVGMTASATMPNMLMQVFGFDTQVISIKCKAEEYYVNTDVMMVLDTTGSMNCSISDPLTCGQQTEKSDSKMKELRTAVKTLYTNLRPAQLALEAKSLRMRIGFVMYASNANVGKLIYAENPAYINNASSSYRDSSGNLYAGPTQTAAWMTGTGASDWTGCIIERQTDSAITSSTTSIPATALDLDIATLPYDTASRWSPHVPSLYQANAYGYSAYSDNDLMIYGYSACARPAVHMKAWASTADFDAYVDTIQTGIGGTYHDIGMIWGTRMIANQGIFAARNPDTFNSVKVRRTIVLVTDGYMSPNQDIYTAYGVERYDQRIGGGSTSDLTDRHQKRFALMCERARMAPIKADVWVIAILPTGSTMPSNLTDCAPGGQALMVSNTTALNNAFKAISDKVGNLRIGG